MTATAPALETVGLSKRYRRGRPFALEAVTISIRTGSFVALVGPNGAGKSTLIRSFMGFERPTAGTVRVTGIDVARDPKASLGAIGYVGQAPGLYRELSAREHLDLAASLRPAFDRTVAEDRLERLGVGLSTPAGQLSGGQQAQLGLAMAIGTRAPVLLLDEPLASLDPLARREFLTTVSGAVAGGTTVLLASHIIGDLEGFCDQVIVLSPARVRLDAETAWVLAHHRLVPLADVGGLDVIGTFADRHGIHQALVRTDELITDPVPLDEIVLGYLASRPTQERAA